jgi:hypothetical protein
LVQAGSVSKPQLLLLTQDELMRHEAGITAAGFLKTLRQWCGLAMRTYLHEPVTARTASDRSALNQVSDGKRYMVAPGMPKDKVQALIKTLRTSVCAFALGAAQTPLPAWLSN